MGAVRIDRIDPGRHDLSDFGCGDLAADRWLRQDEVGADRPAGVVVHVASGGGHVLGCYRLGSFQVQTRRPVMSPTAWSLDFERMSVTAVVVSCLGVDQRWQRRGLCTWLMWHALELAAAVAPAVRARLVVAHAETERALGFVGRFGFRAFDSDPRFNYLPMPYVQATISASAASLHSTTVMERPAPDR